MVVALGCPQDEHPLSYDRLDGEWAQWYRAAQRFEYRVPAQDRGDIRHSIMLELALARARDGEKPMSAAMQCRIAACVVAHYWRTQYKFNNGLDCGSCSRKQRAACKEDYLYSECPKALKIESLSQPLTDAEGNVTELGETIADDKADLDALNTEIGEVERALDNYRLRRSNLLEAMELGEFEKDEILDRLNKISRRRHEDEVRLIDLRQTRDHLAGLAKANVKLGELYGRVLESLTRGTPETKALALDALDIKVYAKAGVPAEIHGVIPLELPTTAQTSA